MFSLTLVVGNTAWGLLFNDRTKADEALKTLRALEGAPNNGSVEIADDFGQTIYISHCPIMMLEDMDQSKLGVIERSLHQARTQARFNQVASADTTLRMGNMGSPGMIAPFGRQ